MHGTSTHRDWGKWKSSHCSQEDHRNNTRIPHLQYTIYKALFQNPDKDDLQIVKNDVQHKESFYKNKV